MVGPAEPMLAFVHIPRTAGGTVKGAIANGYSRPRSVGNVVRDPERARRKVQRAGSPPYRWHVLVDHIPYGLYRRYLPEGTRYLTFLREPVGRVLSQHAFHDRPGGPGLGFAAEQLEYLDRLERGLDARAPVRPDKKTRPWIPTPVPLDEAIGRGAWIFQNLATRYLCGRESLVGDLPPDALERAKEHVSQFAFVGITERFDESIVLLGRALGVGPLPYRAQHVRTTPREEISPELHALIVEHNALDIELYRFARERFDEAASAAGDLTPELEELRRRSADLEEAAAPS